MTSCRGHQCKRWPMTILLHMHVNNSNRTINAWYNCGYGASSTMWNKFEVPLAGPGSLALCCCRMQAPGTPASTGACIQLDLLYPYWPAPWTPAQVVVQL